MSHVSTRKGASTDDKDKRQSDNSPVRDMKKKVAANAEKEKMAADKQNGAEKRDKQPEKSDKNTDKRESKQNGDKHQDKAGKSTEKENVDKPKEKSGDKKEKAAEKPADKKETEKAKEDSSKGEKSAKSTQEKSTDKPPTTDKKAIEKPAQNGARQNGHGDAPTVSADSDSEDMIIVIDDQEADELFPELTYDDDTSDLEAVESQDGFRSMTRRSQAKPTRTPETPRPPSGKASDPGTNQGKEKDHPQEATKLLKLKDDPSSATERKLRSTDPPKQQTETAAESPKKLHEGKRDDDVLVIDDADNSQDGESRKPDTNFSKSRVKVSPYRRSMRLADQTTSSVNATYTGNNTTMEMDITESSYTELPSVSDELSNSTDLNGSSVSALRSIRGRRSYKPLKELTLRTVTRRPPTMPLVGSEQPSRPTGTVVGRKRKPDEAIEAVEAVEAVEATELHAKRMRLLDKLMSPFRRTVLSSTPLPARRAAAIVGINTDLPLSAPVAATEPFEPEALKNVPTAAQPTMQPVGQDVGPTGTLVNGADDSTKRCIVM